VLGIAADHGPTVQLVDLVRGEWDDPLTIIIVRSTLTRNGTAPEGFQIWVRQFVSISEGYVTFRSGNISVMTFLYIYNR